MSTNKGTNGMNYGLRAILGDMKLPKEALAAALAQADKTKRDMIQSVIDELKEVLLNEKMRDLLKSVLDGMEIEINAKIKLTPQRKKKTAIKRSSKKL